MSSRKLLLYPDPILRQKAHEVREFGHDLKPLTDDMRIIMKANAGMGLAAPQVGDSRRIIVVEYPGDKASKEPAIPFTVLINPKITNKSDKTDSISEGCLSVPAIEIPIERSLEMTVIAQDLKGEPVRIRAKGIFARILQHEIDHLNGVLILDYAIKETKKDALRTMVWGSTTFTTGVLNTIAANPLLNITHIVTEAPKPSGRGQEVKPTIVRTYADTMTIPCLEPHTLHDERFVSYLKAQQPDLFIVAAYGKLLPKEILEIPSLGCLNIHPSLLPKHRGATPIQSAILNNDKKTGVTIITMSPEFDTGDILAQSEFKLNGHETYDELELFTAELGGEILNEILLDYSAHKLIAMPQDNQEATGTKKITQEDRWLNPKDDPKLNERKVRAFSPSPLAFVMIDGQPLKVVSAHLEKGELVFDEVQPAGKKPMHWEDFKRGYRKDVVFQKYKLDS
jgi:methionyl-tRNA formyltransferase